MMGQVSIVIDCLEALSQATGAGYDIRWVACVGSNAERLHDDVDNIYLDAGRVPPVTTWHEDDVGDVANMLVCDACFNGVASISVMGSGPLLEQVYTQLQQEIALIEPPIILLKMP